MKEEKNIEKSIRENFAQQKTITQATEKMDERILMDATAVFQESRLGLWEWFVHSAFAKVSVVTIIVIGVLLAVNPFGGAGVAWTDVVSNIADIDNFFFCLKMTVIDEIESQEESEATWSIYLSSLYGFRMDTQANNTIISQMFVPSTQDRIITVIPKEKKWMQMPVNPEELRQKQETERDPRKYIEEFMSCEYIRLGRKSLDGITVEGIEVKNPPSAFVGLEDAVGRLWVEVETDLPVKIEFEGKTEGKRALMVMDFRWNEEFDVQVFTPDIKSDYTRIQ
jgi:hypothetical protein